MRLLRQRRLALLFGGAALNEIGSWATLIAVWGYSAYRFHAGPDRIALISLMWSAPGAILGLVSGWPIDRFGPKVTLMVSNVVGMGTSLGMAYVSSYNGLALLVLASGSVMAFGNPAANSLPPRMVDDEDLLSANSLMGMTTQSAIVFGPLVASVSISQWGVRTTFLIDAATFVLGNLAIVPLRLRPLPVAAHSDGAPSDLLAGLRMAWREPVVRRTLMVGLVVFFSWGASMVIEPLYVRDVLHRSTTTLGELQTVFGVGLLGTTMLLPRFGDKVVSLRAQAASAAVSGVTAAIYLGTRWLAVAAVGIFAWGVMTSLFLPPFYTLIQRATPPENHGRIMATAGVANSGAGVIAIPLAGLAVGAVGERTTVLVLAALMFVTGAVAWRMAFGVPSLSASSASSLPGDGAVVPPEAQVMGAPLPVAQIVGPEPPGSSSSRAAASAG